MRKFATHLSVRHVVITTTLVLLQSAVDAADPVPLEKVVLKATAHFGFNDTTVNTVDGKAMLDEVGKLKDVTWQTVTATGHTDSVGLPTYNQRLSQRRAAAVKSYLVSNGLAPSMVHTRAEAAKDPIAPNIDEGGRAKNRRTEVEFQGVRASTR